MEITSKYRPMLTLEQEIEEEYQREEESKGIEVAGGVIYEASSALNAARVAPKEIEWLLYPYFPKGKVVGAEGDSELGKSTVLIDLMAKITRGEPIPGGERTEPSSVVYVSFEDDPDDTTIPRFIKAGADMSKVTIIHFVTIRREEPRFFDLSIPSDRDFLRYKIESTGAVFVVIDPITQALGGRTDSYKETDVRKAMAPLMQMAQETGACIVNVRHHKKGKSENMKEQGIGSGGFFNIPRSVIGFYPDPEDETEEMRLFVHKKSNLSKKAAPVKYRVLGSRTETPSIQWLGKSTLTNKQILEGTGAALGALRQAIMRLFSGRTDCLKASIIIAAMEDAGYSEDNTKQTLRRMVHDGQLENREYGMYCRAGK